jgi:hypothetical protein
LNAFTWREDAARSFRYVRQLQKHEESLIAELQRHAALLKALNPAHPRAADFEQRVNQIRAALEPETADAATTLQRGILDEYASELSQIFTSSLSEVGMFGFSFVQVAQGVGGSLHFVKPNSGDPRLSTSAPRGGVLVAVGEFSTLVDDVWSFVRPQTAELAPLNRAALVQVIHGIGLTTGELQTRRDQWKLSLAQRVEPGTDFKFDVDVVPLKKLADDPDQNLTTVERIAAALVGYGAWVHPELRPMDWIPPDTPPLDEALQNWEKSEDQIFYIGGATMRSGRGWERDVLEQNGAAVFDISSYRQGAILASIPYTAMLTGFGQVSGAPDDTWAKLGQWLLSNKRLIAYANMNTNTSGQFKVEDLVQILGAGGKLVLVMAQPLPPELQVFKTMTAPLAPSPQTDKVESGAVN